MNMKERLDQSFARVSVHDEPGGGVVLYLTHRGTDDAAVYVYVPDESCIAEPDSAVGQRINENGPWKVNDDERTVLEKAESGVYQPRGGDELGVDYTTRRLDERRRLEQVFRVEAFDELGLAGLDTRILDKAWSFVYYAGGNSTDADVYRKLALLAPMLRAAFVDGGSREPSRFGDTIDEILSDG